MTFLPESLCSPVGTQGWVSMMDIQVRDFLVFNIEKPNSNWLKKKELLGVVVHTCNLSYLGG